MLNLGEDRKKILNSLNLPSNYIKLTAGHQLHAILKDACRPLKQILETHISPSNIDVTPLWEGHSSITAIHIQPNDCLQFIRYEFEYPDDYKIIGHSIHAVTTSLLAWYWTEEEAPDCLLKELAELLDYPCVEKFLNEISIANEEKYEEQTTWEERFRLSFTPMYI